MTRIALIPGCLALLPAYASVVDPVVELREAVQAAVGWLGAEVTVVAGAQGRRVAETALTARAGVGADEPSYLVVGNGSACRTEKAPGYLDPRAEGFDKMLGAALATADRPALAALDHALGRDLWAEVGAFAGLADLLDGARLAAIDYDGAPYGVQYWVMRWQR